MTEILVDRNGRNDKKLTDLFQKVADYCILNYKLRIPDVRAHVLQLDDFAAIVASNGFPRVPETWQLMQDYLRIKRLKELGNITIFELVSCAGGILTDDGKTIDYTDVYLFDQNNLIDMKLVMAHSLGHVHLLENNRINIAARTKSGYDSPQTKLVELTALTERMYEQIGEHRTTELIDAMEVISSIVPVGVEDFSENEIVIEEAEKEKVYGDKSIWMEAETKTEDKIKGLINKNERRLFPAHRINNIFYILEDISQLEKHEREFVKAYRRMLQFRYALIPDTKIVHEGFSGILDLRFGQECSELVTESEMFDYIKHRTDGMSHQGGINPYGLGVGLFYDIMMRYACGEHGLEFEDITTAAERLKALTPFDKEKGWKKVLDVAESCSDFDLINNHFDERHYSTYGQDLHVVQTEEWKAWPFGRLHIDKISSKEFKAIKNALLFQNVNMGHPLFYIAPGDGRNNGLDQLLIRHETDLPAERFGLEKKVLTLSVSEVESLLKAIWLFTKNPLHLKTIEKDGSDILISYDGNKFSESPYKGGK